MRQRFVLYRSQEEHSADCRKFPFEAIPRRTFLDTNVINCLVKWSDCVFEMNEAPLKLNPTLQEDIESLMHVFNVGRHANWNFLTSEKAIEELSQTKDDTLREELLEYGLGLVGYSPLDGVEYNKEYAEDLARRLRDSHFLAFLPDINDRDLIAHAVALQCDVFCTCDRRTIHEKRETLRAPPLRILTPAEWWQQIRPWAGLWC